MAKHNNDLGMLGSDDFGEEFSAQEYEELAPTAAEEEEAASGPDMFAADPAVESSTPSPAAPQSGYVVLARRYRPQTFGEIVGQEQVKQVLSQAITSGRIGHAYLFSGPRGTGKTSTARILAKALNCQNGGPRPDPCGKCDSCRAIAAGTSLDVIEIDAASNTGVDNIRDLRGGVVLAPFSRFKVYIIDEVHMLSNQAFNALLKTLEEPPSQVIFVLATTELQKVPETIVSRCQAFGFRRFATAEIVEQLNRIMQAEIERRGLTIDPEDRRKILELLARNAEGGMRDAQVALDQVLVLSRDKIDFETVCRFLGAVEADQIDQFVRALYERQTEQLLLMIDQLMNNGQDLERFVKSLTDEVRNLLILRTAPQKPELLNVSPDRLASMRSLAEQLPTSFLLSAAQSFLKLLEEMKSASQPRFLLEFAVIRLTQIEAVEDISKIVARLQNLEKALSGGTALPPSPGGGGAARQAPVAPRPAPAPAPSPTPQPVRPAPARPAAAPREERPHVPTPPLHGPTAKLEAEPHRQSPGFAVPQPAPVAAPQPAPEASAAVALAEPEPQAEAVSAPSGAGADISPDEFFRLLREKTVTRSHIVHITLLDTILVSLSDGCAVIGVNPAERFTFNHLNRPQNLQILKEVAEEIMGRSMVVRLQQVDEAPTSNNQSAPPPSAPPSGGSESRTSAREASPAQGHGAPARPEQHHAEAQAPQKPSAPSAQPQSAGPAQEEEPSVRIYYPPELRQRTVRLIKGEQLMRFMEKHADLKEVFLKVKQALKVEDGQITFRARAM